MFSRRPMALLVSLVVHTACLSLVSLGTLGATGAGAAFSRDSSSAFESGWLQLRGRAAMRPAGRDALLAILSARDGVMIRLSSPRGEAVGLASWSASTGMWLALDRLPPNSPRTLQIWSRIGTDPRKLIGTIEVDADGSGRIVGIWSSPPFPTGVVRLEVSQGIRIWPFGTGTIVLEGASAP
jgi:hypothetical protein